MAFAWAAEGGSVSSRAWWEGARVGRGRGSARHRRGREAFEARRALRHPPRGEDARQLPDPCRNLRRASEAVWRLSKAFRTCARALRCVASVFAARSWRLASDSAEASRTGPEDCGRPRASAQELVRLPARRRPSAAEARPRGACGTCRSTAGGSRGRPVGRAPRSGGRPGRLDRVKKLLNASWWPFRRARQWPCPPLPQDESPIEAAPARHRRSPGSGGRR